jgi:hypothetical protein
MPSPNQFLFSTQLANMLSEQIARSLPNGFADSVEAEIQEMGATALFRILQATTCSAMSELERHEVLLNAGHFLSSQLPMREDGFRWMVVLLRQDEVVDSVFGGSVDLPFSG